MIRSYYVAASSLHLEEEVNEEEILFEEDAGMEIVE
jgi:hypothetical protein